MAHYSHLSERELLATAIDRSYRLIEADVSVTEAIALFQREHLHEAIVWNGSRCLGILTERVLLYGACIARQAPDSASQTAIPVMQLELVEAVMVLESAIVAFDDLLRYRESVSTHSVAPASDGSAGLADARTDLLARASDPYLVLLDADRQPCGSIGPEFWRSLDRWQLPTLYASYQAARADIVTQQQQVQTCRQALEQQRQAEQLCDKISRHFQTTSSLEMTLKLGVDGLRELLGCDRAIVHPIVPADGGVVAEPAGEPTIALSVAESRWALEAARLDHVFGKDWPPVCAIDAVSQANLSLQQQQTLAQMEVCSLLAVVIVVSDVPWGVLAVHRCAEPQPWQASDLPLLQRLATILSSAIEQTRLFDRLEVELQERWRVEGEIRRLNEQLEFHRTEQSEELGAANLALERQVKEHQLLVEKWRTSEMEVRTFFEAMTEVVLMVDTQLNVVRIAPTNPQLLYGQETDVFTKTVEMFCDPEQISPHDATIQTVIATQSASSIKYRLTVDEQPRWFYARVSPVAGTDCVAWVAQDITAFEQSEAARIATEKRLSLLVDGVSHYGIFELDLEGQIASWNTGAERIHGYSEAEAIGQSYALLFGAKVNEQSSPQHELELARLHGRYEGEGARKHRSGRSVWADVTISALYDDAEEMRGFAVVVRDITEERRSKVWQRLLERAIDASANGVIITDATHPMNPVVYVNSGFQAMTGYSEYEAIGRNCRFLQGDERDQPGLKTLRQALVEEQGCRVTLRNYRKDGSVFWNELTISPVKNDRERVTHYVGIQTDITESQERKIELTALGAKLQAVFDSTCDLAIFSTASDGTIQLANMGARQLLGCPESVDLQLFSLDRFFSRTEIQQRYAKLGNVHLPVEASPSNFECLTRCCSQERRDPYVWTLRRYDGSPLCVSLEIAPIDGGNQQIFGFVAIARDITERSRMQTELQQSKMLLDGVLNSSIDGIIALQSVRDPDSHQIVDFQWLVSNATIGRLMPDFSQVRVGQRLLEAMPEHRDSGLFDAYVSVVEQGELFERELYYSQTASPTWIQLTAVKLGDGLAVTFRNITKTKAIETQLQETNEELQTQIQVLDSRNRDMLKLGELNEYLQASETVEDTYNVVAAMMPDLFGEDCGGGIYRVEDGGNLTRIATWGEQPPVSAQTFHRQDCWALRRSRHHLAEQHQQGLMCPHLTDRSAIGTTLCTPLSSQGKSLGLLHLWSPQTQAFNKAKRQLAYTVAEQLSLSVTNLLLRESLKLQSIRDPLTSLFNRRYMEDTLERLLHNAQERKQSLGIIMVDIDCFKRFNDRYGHAVGDLVLCEVAQLLPQSLTPSDIACRYGGEELMVILPDLSAIALYNRAEQLRAQIAALPLFHDGQAIEQVTASFGISMYPECGRDRRDLLREADDALYRAKNDGRNCVRLAQAIVEPVAEIDPSYPRRSASKPMPILQSSRSDPLESRKA